MTFFNTLYFLNDEISSFLFFRFESAPLVAYTTLEEEKHLLQNTKSGN